MRQKPTSPPANTACSATTALPDLLPPPEAQPGDVQGRDNLGQAGTINGTMLQDTGLTRDACSPDCLQFLFRGIKQMELRHISGGKADAGQLKGGFTPFLHQDFT